MKNYKLIIRKGDNAVWISWFEVNIKGIGLGRKVWERIEKEIWEDRDIKVIMLNSLEESIGFWKKMGFEEGSYMAGKIIMWKEGNGSSEDEDC